MLLLCIFFKVTCPRLASLCQTNILKPLSNILSDNNTYFNQRGEKAAGALAISLGLFSFIVGKRNIEKINYFCSIAAQEGEIGLWLRRIFKICLS